MARPCVYANALSWAGLEELVWTRTAERSMLESASNPAFSELGMPVRFHAQVVAQGIEIGGEERLNDHYAYSSSDLTRLQDQAKSSGCRYLLTTHKDAVKIDPGWLLSLPLYYLNMALRLVAGDDIVSTVLDFNRAET